MRHKLASACGDRETAEELFEQAARRYEHAGAPAFAARDRRHHGEMLLAAGQHDRAEQILQQAAREADALGLASRRVSGEEVGQQPVP